MRKPLKKFAEYQEKILKENDYKEGWGECCINDLYGKLREETSELIEILLDSGEFNCINPIKDLVDKEHRENISKECADIANFAMMIYSNINKEHPQ